MVKKIAGIWVRLGMEDPFDIGAFGSTAGWEDGKEEGGCG
jgi:hypothetical protein